MKRLNNFRNNFLLLNILFFSLCSLISFNGFAKTKYAILVGVGNQPVDTKWKSTSAENDVKVMQQSLKNKGFDSIIVLIDKAATKSAIMGSIERTLQKMQKGDVFLFHFSGHGQKLMDDNGDEIDGYDEALVAYGAPSAYDKWYNYEHHIRDDEFSEIMDKVRAKLGENGDVLILIDAGFGEKSSNQGDSIRGGVAAFAPEGFVNRSTYLDKSAGVYEDRPFGMPAMNFAPIVSISACITNLVSMEYRGNGLLTICFDRALELAKKGDTYMQLFNNMNQSLKQIGINQMMVIEGFYENKMFNLDLNMTSYSNFSDEEMYNVQALQSLSDREDQEVLKFIKENDPRIKVMF